MKRYWRLVCVSLLVGALDSSPASGYVNGVGRSAWSRMTTQEKSEYERHGRVPVWVRDEWAREQRAAAAAVHRTIVSGYVVSVADAGRLFVVAGKPLLVTRLPEGDSREAYWEVSTDPDSGNTAIRPFDGPWRGRYLSYDSTGKDKTVFLSFERRDNSIWKPSTTGPSSSGSRKMLQAAAGELRGWFLDFAEEEERIPVGDGKIVVGHRLILSEKPGRIRQLQMSNVSPAAPRSDLIPNP